MKAYLMHRDENPGYGVAEWWRTEMRRCEDCKHSECLMPMSPELPDLWICKARGGMGVLHPVLRALTCRGFESRYRLQRRAINGEGQDQTCKNQGA